MMKSNLLFQALTKFFLGVILLGILIFLPAGSFHYWQGWLLLGVLFVPIKQRVKYKVLPFIW